MSLPLKPLALRLYDVLERAPEGWDRSVVITRDRDLEATTITLMDAFYVWGEEGDLDDVKRLQTKHLLYRGDLEGVVNANDLVAATLEAMARDLEREHE